MYSRLLPLLLSVLLVCVQQGGILHALSHWHGGMAAADPSLTASDRSIPDDSGDHECLTCVAFAVVATALSGLPFCLSPVAAPLPQAVRCTAPHTQVLVKAYNSRAPPSPSV